MQFKRSLKSGNHSAAMGKLISLGSLFSTKGLNDITDEFINTVAPCLEGTMSDVVPSYAIVLWFANKVRYEEFQHLHIANII